MKYIDAEKLKEGISKYWRQYHEQEREEYDKGFDDAIDCILNIIDFLQQERPNDVGAEMKEYYGEEIPFEDERTKAAYHFFSAGRSFELKNIEEDYKEHITHLIENFRNGIKAGYKRAITELKEGKIECNPVIKEFIDKLFNIGNKNNFGFGPKDFLQEGSTEVDLEKVIEGLCVNWNEDEEYGLQNINTSTCVTLEEVKEAMRCTFELGLKARQED